MISVDEKKIAAMVVNKSMKLKEDDLILINTGSHNLPFAKACALEIMKTGGHPILEVISDKMVRSYIEEVPDDYLAKPQSKKAKLFEHITGFMYLEPEADPANASDLPAYKKGLYNKSKHPIRRARRENDVKGCLFLYPTPQMAEAYGIDWEYYHDRVWSSIMIDPDELYKIGKPVKTFLSGKDKVHITSAKGTDIKFSIKERGILICNGEELDENKEICRYSINIPAGEVFTTIIEDSAEGVAVFDKVFAYGMPVEDLRLEFKNGSLIGFDAANGKENFAKFYNNLKPADKVAAELGIGINPYIKDVIGCFHTDEKIAGTIHIAIGSSIVFGGKNDAAEHFDMIMDKPDVTVDGEVFMRKGELAIRK